MANYVMPKNQWQNMATLMGDIAQTLVSYHSYRMGMQDREEQKARISKEEQDRVMKPFMETLSTIAAHAATSGDQEKATKDIQSFMNASKEMLTNAGVKEETINKLFKTVKAENTQEFLDWATGVGSIYGVDTAAKVENFKKKNLDMGLQILGAAGVDNLGDKAPEVMDALVHGKYDEALDMAPKPEPKAGKILNVRPGDVGLQLNPQTGKYETAYTVPDKPKAAKEDKGPSVDQQLSRASKLAGVKADIAKKQGELLDLQHGFIGSDEEKALESVKLNRELKVLKETEATYEAILNPTGQRTSTTPSAPASKETPAGGKRPLLSDLYSAPSQSAAPAANKPPTPVADQARANAAPQQPVPTGLQSVHGDVNAASSNMFEKPAIVDQFLTWDDKKKRDYLRQLGPEQAAVFMEKVTNAVKGPFQ